MKKNCLKIICIAIIFVIVLCVFNLPRNVEAITYYNGNSIGINDNSNIEVISIEAKIDTINSEVIQTTIIKNKASINQEKTIELPIKNGIIETKIKDLQVFINDLDVKYKLVNEQIQFKTKMDSNEAKKIVIKYKTENNLLNSKVIKYNFENLNFGNNIIKKAKVDIIIRDRDVPLVNKITPGHYTFKDNTISVEYYNFKVNTLTKQVIVEKDTYEELEKRGEDNFVIDNKIFELVPTWEKEGIKLNSGDYETTETPVFNSAPKKETFFDIDTFFQNRTGIKVINVENDEEAYWGKNYSKNAVRIANYYLAKTGNKDVLSRIADIQGTTENNITLVNELIIKKKAEVFGTNVKDLSGYDTTEYIDLRDKIICIDYVKEYQNEDLYVNQTVERIDEFNYKKQYIKKSEDEIFATELYNIARAGNIYTGKIIFLGRNNNATDEEKVEYINMINTDFYIRQKLFDGRSLGIAKDDYEQLGHSYVGYNDNYEIAKTFYNAGKSESESDIKKRIVQDTKDYALKNSEVPTVVQYLGTIYKDSEKNIVELAFDGFYNSYSRGLVSIQNTLKTTSAKELLQKNKSKNSEIKSNIESEISSLKLKSNKADQEINDEKIDEKQENTIVNYEKSKEENSFDISKIEYKTIVNIILFVGIGVVFVLIIILIIKLIKGGKNNGEKKQ